MLFLRKIFQIQRNNKFNLLYNVKLKLSIFVGLIYNICILKRFGIISKEDVFYEQKTR